MQREIILLPGIHGEGRLGRASRAEREKNVLLCRKRSEKILRVHREAGGLVTGKEKKKATHKTKKKKNNDPPNPPQRNTQGGGINPQNHQTTPKKKNPERKKKKHNFHLPGRISGKL